MKRRNLKKGNSEKEKVAKDNSEQEESEKG